ncbi:MAG: hypothetical protein SFZ03_00360 [Candidatus Melainabacteria bacterium]|nr:hypothetical protein [Candidatus Melainabacteria bacterium]
MASKHPGGTFNQPVEGALSSPSYLVWLSQQVEQSRQRMSNHAEGSPDWIVQFVRLEALSECLEAFRKYHAS